MKRAATTWCAVALLAGMAGCAGLYQPLPRIDPRPFEARLSAIPSDAAFRFSWHAVVTELRTYWDAQSVTVQAEVWFPRDWKAPGDEVWRAEARNAEGKPIPFLGIERRQVGDDGTERPFLVPEVDVRTVPDGLYLLIAPQIAVKAGTVETVRPVAHVREVRKGAWQPFLFRVSLAPDQADPRTPMPPAPLPKPIGTPLPGE